MKRSWVYILAAIAFGGLGSGTTVASYAYAGRSLTGRDITTSSAAETHVKFEVLLDAHRRQARLTNRTVAGTASTVLDQTDYTYDADGNRLSASISAGDRRLGQTAGDGYGYDNLDRLTSAAYPAGQSEAFAYDKLGNRSSYADRRGRQSTYTHNEVNEYTNITTGGQPPAQAPVYDAAGNLTVTENGYRLSYDYENRLVEVKAPAPDDTVLASYTYDALGRRIVSNIIGREMENQCKAPTTFALQETQR